MSRTPKVLLLLALGILSAKSLSDEDPMFSEDDPRMEYSQDCMNFDSAVCIGGNYYLSPVNLRTQDTSLLAHFDFSNDLGLDISETGNGRFNL